MTRQSVHPSGDELLAFLRAADAPEASQRTREHLLAGCVRCLRELQRRSARARRARREEPQAVDETFPARGAGLSGSRQEDLVERAGRTLAVVEAERAAAPGLVREILLLPPEERREAIRGRERYRFLGLAERLTAEARRACFHDVGQALELGRLAFEVADCLDRQAYPPGLVADRVALALGALGNAHRVAGDLREAGRALQAARERLEQGSQDPWVRGELLSLLGSLRTAEARFDEAVEALAEAAGIYRACGEPGEEAKVLMQLGNAAGERGETGAAAAYLAEARQRLPDDAPGELDLVSAQAHMGWLLVDGRAPEARDVLREIDGGARDREPSFRLRQGLAWATARLLWAEGDRQGAERGLRAVREGYLESEEVYRACLLGLDLAMLYLEEGRTDQVRELSREMLPVFASREFHHNALQALALFQRSAEGETATVAMLEELSRYLRQSARNPHLPYRPEGDD